MNQSWTMTNNRTIERDGEQVPDFQTISRLQSENILNSRVHTRLMVSESPTNLFTPASVRNTVSNITNSMRRGLNRLDTFYNPVYPQEKENIAIIASCSYYRSTRKAFDWFTEIKNKENFGLRLITAVQSDPIMPMKFNDAWNHEDHNLWREAIQQELNSMKK